jgi:hypothetical protein
MIRLAKPILLAVAIMFLIFSIRELLGMVDELKRHDYALATYVFRSSAVWLAAALIVGAAAVYLPNRKK